MSRALRAALGALALLCAVTAGAQAPPPPFHRYLHQGWSTEAGLPQVSVNAMVRDPNGLLWVGTENGLARFDGSEFEDLSGVLRELTGTTWVTALARDVRGRVWVGTLNGVVVAEQGVLRAVVARDGPAPGKVHAIALDTAGEVCVAAQQLWCTRDGILVAESGWQGESRALATSTEALWIAGDGQLARRVRGAIEPVGRLPEALARARIDALVADTNGLWIGSTAGLWHHGGDALQPLPLDPERGSPPGIRALALDAQGTLWASTLAAVYRFDGGRLLERVAGRALHDLGTVISLLADDDGSLWLGSQANGLMHVWHAGIEQLGGRDGLGNLSVWTYASDAGGLLAGTDDGVWSFAGDRFEPLLPGSALPNPVAYSLLHAADGRLFVGTRAGLARFSGTHQPEHRYPELATLQVNALLEEPGVGVWAATLGGLYRIEGDLAQHIGADAAQLGSARARSLLLDRAGTLWVGTEAGLFRRREEGFQRVPEPGPARAFVMALAELPDGRLLAGSYDDGVFVQEASGWRRLLGSDGLPSDTVFFMDVAGDALIASHPNGVYRLPLPQLEARTARPLTPQILMHDIGRQPDRTRLRCCNGGGNGRGILHGGFAWFPTLAGAMRVRLDLAPSPPPAATLRSARQGARVLEHAPRVLLAPGNRRLTLGYGAVDFRDAARLRYRYRLSGIDEDWIAAERRREAFYTSLPAGEYRFAVQARRQHEPWGPAAEVAIAVPPMLSERWPFRVGVALAIALATALLLRLREARGRAQQARLEAIVAERTQELSTANERLAALNDALAAASVTDPLTGLHNRRFIHEQIGSVVATLRRNRARSGEDRVIGICVADIDHFKRVNDDYGHATGDRVLKRVAAALRREMRDGDYLLRWGGEEFVVITNESLRPALAPIVERLRAAVEASTGAPGEPTRVTVSIGYAAYPLPGHALDSHDWLSAMNLADQALYGAKAAGRNRIATVEIAEAARASLPEHISAAQLAELYASGEARLVVGG